jgi:hypothetical protein
MNRHLTVPQVDRFARVNRVLQNFMDWLSDEARGKTLVGYVIFAALADQSISFVLQAAFENWGWVKPATVEQMSQNPLEFYNLMFYVNIFIWGPIREEVFYRVLPLSFITAFVTTSPRWVFTLLIAMSALFGATHPYNIYGKFNVAIAGIFLGLVFLKCGGMNKRYVKASICAVAAHGLVNVLVVLNEYWSYLSFTR